MTYSLTAHACTLFPETAAKTAGDLTFDCALLGSEVEGFRCMCPLLLPPHYEPFGQIIAGFLTPGCGEAHAQKSGAMHCLEHIHTRRSQGHSGSLYPINMIKRWISVAALLVAELIKASF